MKNRIARSPAKSYQTPTVPKNTFDFSCARCNSTFADKILLNIHRSECLDASFTCEHCGRKFKSKLGRDYHRISAHEKSQRHVCHICDKRFSIKARYDGHMNVHYQRRPHQCKICKSRFTCRQTLLKHVKHSCKGETI